MHALSLDTYIYNYIIYIYMYRARVPFLLRSYLKPKAFHFLHALFMFFLAEACSSRMVWRAVPGVTGPTIPTHHFVLSRVSWASKLPYLDVRCLSWLGTGGCMVPWLPWMWAEWFVSCKCLLQQKNIDGLSFYKPNIFMECHAKHPRVSTRGILLQ